MYPEHDNISCTELKHQISLVFMFHTRMSHKHTCAEKTRSFEVSLAMQIEDDNVSADATA